VTQPADADKVIAAIRLGWTMVELRGLYFGDLDAQTDTRSGYVLPLQFERSPPEHAIEVEATLIELAVNALKVDVATSELPSGQSQAGPEPGLRLRSARPPSGNCSTLLQNLGKIVMQTRHDPTQKHQAAMDVAHLLFEWDSKIQDHLAAAGQSQADGFQLGKGFAEIRWVLDPSIADPKDFQSWMFLLGDIRLNQLTRLLRRMNGYLDDLTIHALAASLWAWSQVAALPDLRSASDSQEALNKQSVVWHDLLTTGLEAKLLLTPEDVLRSSRGIGFVAAKFVWQIGIATIAAILLAGSLVVILISTPAALTHLVAVAASVVAVFGLTLAGIAAKVKDEAGGIVAQLRDAVYSDLVAAAATVLPTGVERRIDRTKRGRDLSVG